MHGSLPTFQWKCHKDVNKSDFSKEIIESTRINQNTHIHIGWNSVAAARMSLNASYTDIYGVFSQPLNSTEINYSAVPYESVRIGMYKNRTCNKRWKKNEENVRLLHAVYHKSKRKSFIIYSIVIQLRFLQQKHRRLKYVTLKYAICKRTLLFKAKENTKYVIDWPKELKDYWFHIDCCIIICWLFRIFILQMKRDM